MDLYSEKGDGWDTESQFMNTPHKTVLTLLESCVPYLCHQERILLPDQPLKLEFDFILRYVSILILLSFF